jgi:IQ calmodulin-binding motif
MSAVATHYGPMYGSPKASMMSRDPDGIDPSGTVDDSVVGLEPAGSRAEEAMTIPDSVSNVENEAGPLSMDIADLVGAPPPPPNMPPPKKLKKRTPKNITAKKSIKSEALKATFGSFDDDSLLQDLARSSSTITTPRSAKVESLDQNVEFTMQRMDTADSAQSDDSLKVDTPPREVAQQVEITDSKDASPTSRIVEERVKAALALYLRDDIVLEDQTEFIALTPQEILRSVGTTSNKEETKVGTPKSNASPSLLESPKSSTKIPSPITSQNNNVTLTATSSANNISILSDIVEAAPITLPTANAGQQEKSTRRTASIERRQQTDDKQKRDQKRGFFKKLFRGRGKNRDVEENTSVIAPKSTPSGRSPRVHESVSVSPAIAHLKPTLKNIEERHYQGGVLTTNGILHQDEMVTDDGHVDVNAIPIVFFSQDPPDDEHGDPPVFSGRPLISPTSIPRDGVDEEHEASRIESVKLRIADVYDVRSPRGDVSPPGETTKSIPTCLHEEDGDYFLAQDDEVSAITGGFGSKSFGAVEEKDAAVVSGYLLARDEAKHVDAYSTNFFNSSALLPTPSNATKLRVFPPGQSQDPAGESPMHWHYQGKPAGVSTFRDPIGESPVHAWKDADPTLTAGFGLDDDAVSGIHEEKKEEDPFPEPQLTMSNSSNSATPFEQDFLNGPSKSMESKGEGVSQELPTEPRTTVNGTEKIAPLRLQTDIEKAGFKSASNTPVAGGKTSLTISTAAFTNAKAVAYLHRLHGEPSPRHTWHASKRQTVEPSPLAAKANSRKSSKKKQVAQSSSKKKPCPDDYGAHNVEEALLARDDAVTSKPPVNHEELYAIKSKEGALFGAYNSKFQGRKPTKKKTMTIESPRNGLSLGSRGRQNLPSPSGGGNFYASMKPGKITASAVSRGMRMRRAKRDEDIALGKSERVVLTPKPKTEGRNRFHFFHYADESDIKDPIQRAGRRILSKSAIPIQCAARRYIAKREAVDRMWALIEVQSYYRRWRAEASLQASIHSAVQIQSTFRGWSARDKLKDMNYSATQIQKIVRGYICQAKVYDCMYYIVRLQAFYRGCSERTRLKKKQAAATELQKYLRGYKIRSDIFKGSRVTPFQSLYRGHKARQDFYVAVASAKLLQAVWRSCAARISYQVEIVDIIIAQSVVRRWLAGRTARSLQEMELFGPASLIQAAWRGCTGRQLLKKNLAARKIQTTWRGFRCYTDYKKSLAARKIQTTWRGFRCYTDYIFALVDILVVQRTVRVFLAKRKASSLRREKAAVRIQCCWRRHKAESTLLYSLVHIIIAQSVARRFLAKATVQNIRRNEATKHEAAIAIQKTWRKFWGFSHYIIVQYEVARLQAHIRGKLARQSYNLKLGCAIIIQATIRRHLAKNAILSRLITGGAFDADARSLRERNAAKKIQFWWRIVLDWTKEKKAALTIERFFIHVRAEVDREIMRRERKKMLKQERRRQHRRDDDKVLERAWLKTVDENTAISMQSNGNRSQSAPRLRDGSLAIVTHRTPSLINQMMSPKVGSIGQEVDIHGWPIQRMDSGRTSRSRPPADSVQMAPSEDFSDVSNLTNPTVFHRAGGPPGRYDAGHGRPSHRMSTEDYIKKYGGVSGLQTAPNRTTPSVQSQHFFSDDGSVASSKIDRTAIAGHPIVLPPTPRSMSLNHSSKQRSSSTPRAQHSDGFGQVTPGGFSSAGRSKPSTGVTTPRNNYGHSVGVPTPRSSASSHQVPSPRIQVGYPPVTPRGYKGGSKMQISRRDTADTESHTTYTQNSFSRSSPRVGHIMNNGSSPNMVIKNHPSISQSYSNGEEDLMYLGGEVLGDEYGEV